MSLLNQICLKLQSRPSRLPATNFSASIAEPGTAFLGRASFCVGPPQNHHRGGVVRHLDQASQAVRWGLGLPKSKNLSIKHERKSASPAIEDSARTSAIVTFQR